MWQRLSLRQRISLLLCAMFLCFALLGLALLREFAASQLRDENEAAAEAVAAMSAALNSALREAQDAPHLLRAYLAGLPQAGSPAVRFESDDEGFRSAAAQPARDAKQRVPLWFKRFLDPPRIAETYAVSIAGRKVGDIVFEPSMEAELYEKWVGFLLITVSAGGLALVTIAITSFTVGKALRPLRQLDHGLGRLRDGDYTHQIGETGLPDIAGSLTAANDLASTLRAYDGENRALLRKIISVQDDERRDLARELHDELGPLLFSIRANAIALTGADAVDRPDHPSRRLMDSVEGLQTTNRRILERLRPNDIDALGLCKSIEALIDWMRREAPALTITSHIDPAIEDLDLVVGQTIYRVVQEGVTNVLRHAAATEASVDVTCRDGRVGVIILDNGKGLPAETAPGRGMTGMRERTRAIGGRLEIANYSGGGTRLHWRLDNDNP